MKLALVHDHLAQDGGAEKVLKALQEMFPEAPTFCMVHDQAKANPFFSQRDIRTSFIQRLPGGVKHYQWFLPLMPLATERCDLSEYDLVISSSSAFAKGVITRPQTMHISYCHTPTRFLWSDTHEYVRELKYPHFVKRFLPLFLTNIRLWDKASADRVDHFIANSRNVQQRIWKYYRRPSEIIYPPVEVTRHQISNQPEDYFLTGGRLVYYKRFDVTVKAFNHLKRRLKIFGTGPELARLKKMAQPNIEFTGFVNDDQLAELYSKCLGFIHPQEEDFGITPVESMAAGRPVIAFAAGGALETVKQGVTGQFFKEQTWEALAEAVNQFQPDQFDPRRIREHARQFDVENFKSNFKKFLERIVSAKSS